MPVIFSTHGLHLQAAAMLAAAGELRIATTPDPATLLAEGRDAAVIIVRAPLPEPLMAAPELRAAIRHGAGIDMIPVDAATAAGVLVANVPGANARTVAEHAILVILALLRRSRLIDRDLRRDGWLAARAHADRAHDLAGRTLGIVGMGAVGRSLLAIARGFGLDVLVHTRTPAALPKGARHVPLDTLMAAADIIVLACPLTPETTGLVGRDRIVRMQPHALLVNVARGPVVDEAALIDALAAGRIGGAALDVFATQPLPPDHPLLGFDNVIVTPHLAGITEESMLRMGTGAAAEALRVLAGALPVNLRNPDAVPRYRQRFPHP
jgi:D-3-phosphoglycerate dehydrogenase